MALVAATGLLLELALTRLLSVVLWYHWAFFAVTTALFGLALPGFTLLASSHVPSCSYSCAGPSDPSSRSQPSATIASSNWALFATARPDCS